MINADSLIDPYGSPNDMLDLGLPLQEFQDFVEKTTEAVAMPKAGRLGQRWVTVRHIRFETAKV